MKRFDRKFGADLIRELPDKPGVYLFKDAGGAVLYAGKAKNIRRRLQSYRNASRRKAHRKMRTLVQEASSLEVRLQPSEREALLVENELIRRLRPPYNVEGAYSFLYPAIGCAVRAEHALLCFTTRVDALGGLQFRWHGSFRSRRWTLESFDALVSLLSLLGHREPASRLPAHPPMRGTRLVALRRIEAWMPSVERLLAGESPALLRELSLRLLEKPDARRDAEAVGSDLRQVEAFFHTEAQALREVLRDAGQDARFVSQQERDALFIAHRYGAALR